MAENDKFRRDVEDVGDVTPESPQPKAEQGSSDSENKAQS